MGMEIKLPSDAEIKRMFDAVPALERYKVADAVVRAGVKPITDRARQLVPRGTAADRAKQSGKQRSASHVPLWKTVKAVVRTKRDAGAVAVTGPEFTGSAGAGQKIYLIAEHKSDTRRVFYWGKDQGRTVQKIRNIMVQAAEETRSQQLSIMKSKLKEKMDEVWKRGN